MARVTGTTFRPNPARWTWELRNWFLYFLVREDRYKQSRDRLEPLWERVIEARPEVSPTARYFELPAPSGEGHIDITDPLVHYIYAVQTLVVEQLRCKVGGVPAPWVCHALHAGVTGNSMDPGVVSDERVWYGELAIPITSAGSAFVVRRINRVPTSDLSEVEDQALEVQRPFTPFDRWDDLRRMAHRELDRLLAELQEQSEDFAESWPRMYLKGRVTRTQETMRKLVRWVVGREEQWGRDRSATNRLLRELHLDPPGKSQKSGQDG